MRPFVIIACLTALFAGTVPDSRAADHAVPATPFSRDLNSISLEEMVARGLDTGIYHGSPQMLAEKAALDADFYGTLAAEKRYLNGDRTKWEIVPIRQEPPPPCDQPQPTGYDADSCRYAAALFREREASDPAAAQRDRERVRRGRDMWFKGSFGDQDLYNVHLSRALIGSVPDYTAWLDTRNRAERFRKFGLINDPDCRPGSEATYWLDDCDDEHSTGVVGFRKYYAPASDGFDPRRSPYEKGEIAAQKRFVVGVACASCHVSFDPTNPPADPASPRWENLMGGIGNQYIRHAVLFSQSLPADGFMNAMLRTQRAGTSDTSLVANDFMHNPGTINAIMNTHQRPLFEHEMIDPITGERHKARTRQVLKGGEDSVGERLALLRVYVNIGMCAQECWTPGFPEPGSLITYEGQKPFSIKQCAKDCAAWNWADAKIEDLLAYLLTVGPTYLDKATDVDGTPGAALIDEGLVPRGRQVFVENCARCHSSKAVPAQAANDPKLLGQLYEGHVFGGLHAWRREFPAETLSGERFARFLDPKTQQPLQVARGEQDWLGNDQRVPVQDLGINRCRAMHSNHRRGHTFAEFGSETYHDGPSPGSLTETINPLLPLIGGMDLFGSRVAIEGGPGYLRNVSLLSTWSSAPFLHNNALGPYPTLPDGDPDYTVRGRVAAFEATMRELLTSDDPAVSPHREPVVARADRDLAVPTRSDGKGFLTLSLDEGAPIGFASNVNPHRPLYSQCDDYVENKGHQFGIGLPDSDKAALIEFVKTL